MKNLDELLDSSRNDHLTHLEDLVLHSGTKGLDVAIRIVKSVVEQMKGHDSGVSISEKWDGSPSIMAGINPDNGKFFVANKSIFGLNPKLMYDSTDVEKYYPATTYADLNIKFNLALEHFPKLGITGVLQGDILYTEGDLILKEGLIEFKTNTLTYKTADPDTRYRIEDSEIGVVFHTSYSGTKLSEMKASYGYNPNNLEEVDEILVIPARLDFWNRSYAKDGAFDNIEKNLVAIANEQVYIKPEAIEWMVKNKEIFSKFTNQCIRNEAMFINIENYLGGLEKFVAGVSRKEAMSLKTESGQRKKIAKYAEFTHKAKIFQDSIGRIGKITSHLVNIKRDLLNQLTCTNHKFQAFIDNKASQSEGLVVYHEGLNIACKLVERTEFSKRNFENRKSWKPKTLGQALQEKKVVFTFARMNPPTAGHEMLINSLIKKAHELGAEPRVYLSNKHEPTKNPLNKKQRVKYLKMGIPHASDIIMEDPNVVDAFTALKVLYKEGFTDVVFVAGSDRVDTFEKLVERYQGHPDPELAINFKTCVVENIGERDPDSDGIEGVSASAMREFAIKNKYDEFKKASLSYLSDPFVKQMFDEIKHNASIHEEIVHLNNTLGKNRDEMPQIRADDVEFFISWLTTKNVTSQLIFKEIVDLKPTQKEIRSERVEQMADMIRDGKKPRTFIVSIDDFILDGHHEIFALKLLSIKGANCYVVSIPMNKLIPLANEFEGVYHKSV